MALCPDMHSVTVQHTHTECTSTTRTSSQGGLHVQANVSSTHTSSVTVQVGNGASLDWKTPVVRNYIRERTPESRTLTWRGIVLCTLPLDVPWATDDTVSDVLSKSITQRLGIPRTHQDEVRAEKEDKPPLFEQQPVSVRLDPKPVQLPTGQRAFHFTAVMDSTPSNLWERGDVLRGDLTESRLVNTKYDPMTSLSNTLFGPDDERAKAMRETLSKGLSGYATPLPFRVFALGAGDDGHDTTLTETYERMRDVMPQTWRMAQDKPIQQSEATSEALKKMLTTAWHNRTLNADTTNPLDVTLAQYALTPDGSSTEHTCCFTDKVFDEAWMAGYQQHVQDHGDELSFADYRQLRLQAYRDKQFG